MSSIKKSTKKVQVSVAEQLYKQLQIYIEFDDDSAKKMKAVQDLPKLLKLMRAELKEAPVPVQTKAIVSKQKLSTSKRSDDSEEGEQRSKKKVIIVEKKSAKTSKARK